MDESAFFAEVDAVADNVCGSSTMIDDFKIAHREAARAHYPDLGNEEWRRSFERWFVHYRDKLMAREDAADARAFALWDERRRLLLERTFLPPGSERQAAAEQRLKQIALEITGLYNTGRPPVPAAAWISK